MGRVHSSYSTACHDPSLAGIVRRNGPVSVFKNQMKRDALALLPHDPNLANFPHGDSTRSTARLAQGLERLLKRMPNWLSDTLCHYLLAVSTFFI